MSLGSGKTISGAVQSLTFTRRATVIGGLQAGIGVLLAARMAYISVAENERYQLLSESNRVNLTLVPPRTAAVKPKAEAVMRHIAASPAMARLRSSRIAVGTT